jgi:hypothetical protein
VRDLIAGIIGAALVFTQVLFSPEPDALLRRAEAAPAEIADDLRRRAPVVRESEDAGHLGLLLARTALAHESTRPSKARTQRARTGLSSAWQRCAP